MTITRTNRTEPTFRIGRWGFATLTWSDLLTGLLLSLVVGMLYVQFHLFGNTTNPAVYSRSVLGWMVRYWDFAPLYGVKYVQGWLIPPLVAWLVWRQRTALLLLPRRACMTGLLVVGVGLLLHWVGVRTQQTRLSLFALVIILWGLPFALCGWSLARRLAAPMALLLYCIPVNFLDGPTFPIRIAVTATTSTLLGGLGLEAAHRGSSLLLGGAEGLSIEAADTFNGLYGFLLVSLIAAVVGQTRLERATHRWALFFGSLLLAAAANVVRFMILGMLASVVGPLPPGLVQASGWITLLACALILYLLPLAARARWRRFFQA